MTEPAPHVITLGTGGGPVWPVGGGRAGIATAVVVGDRTYLVDAGSGVGRQLVAAGRTFDSLRAIFITHLHSDHIVDLASLFIFGIMRMPIKQTHKIPVIGPGPRGVLPITSHRAAEALEAAFPENPTPGIVDSVNLMMRGLATDINDRHLDSLRATPMEWFVPQDIVIPDSVGFHANDNPTPDMKPIPVYEDDAVRVTAILVKHAPMAPAFGFRIESEGGSVVISGDTAPCDNMIRLAEGADVLLHEALDFDWVERQFEAIGGNATAQAIRDHHYASHTSPMDAIKIAESAGAKKLALHHLVPGSEPIETWERAADASSYAGKFLIPDDLQVIALR